MNSENERAKASLGSLLLPVAEKKERRYQAQEMERNKCLEEREGGGGGKRRSMEEWFEDINLYDEPTTEESITESPF